MGCRRGQGRGDGGVVSAVDVVVRCWGWGRCRGRGRGDGRRVAVVDEVTGRGGGAAAVDKAAGTVVFSLPWTWLQGVGEGLPLWTRPRDGQGGSPL